MPPSAPNPRLPAWIFIATDVVLVAAAAFIGLNSPSPLPTSTVFTLVALVALGALAGLVPLVVAYERQKNEALDDRQRALEALARTVSESAEQISIAAAGLNGIADAAQRSARQAENLPQLLQEKVAEFQLRLGAAQDAERQELERELTRLRASHQEKLEATAERLVQAAAEWSKLAPVIRQQAAAAQEAITQAGTAAAADLTEAAATAARTLPTVTPAAASPAPAAREFTEAKAEAPAEPAPLAAPETPAAPAETVPTSVAPAPKEAAAVAPAEPPAKAPAPKRTRRPKREEPPAAAASEPAPAPAADAPAPAEPVAPATAAETTPAVEIPAVPAVSPAPEPAAPTPAEPVAAAPVPAPETPAASEPAPVQAAAAPAAAAPEAAPEPAPEAEKPLRRRAARKPEPQPEEQPALELDDAGSSSAASVAERVLSSDGATRVLVTAYIGIGNRVFIRGEGAGLSWDKGVPLQFVSIGKWRWENSEASGPVRFKLYKNDEIECAALGAQELQPGHQLEVTAAF